MSKPTFEEEKRLWNKGYTVLGIDEVGRGAFAGPIVAAAVIFDKIFDKDNPCQLRQGLSLHEINDSKLLRPSVREKLATKQSRLKGEKRSPRFARDDEKHEMHSERKFFVLADGFHIRYLYGVGLKNQKAIIKGDQKSISIAAASILAKVYRDNLMNSLHKKYPFYGFDKNKGYGTKKHRDAIKKFGLSTIHRLSFNLRKHL